MTRRLSLRFVIGVAFTLVAALPASAQLIAAKDGPIVYGHHHLVTSNVEAQKKFSSAPLADRRSDRHRQTGDHPVPERADLLPSGAPKGGTKGTTVNHIGFSVPNLRQTVDKVKAAGYPIITGAEVAANQQVKDDIGGHADEDVDRVRDGSRRREGRARREQSATLPIMLHHIHFSAQQVDDMQAWYMKVFGAQADECPRNFQAADLPGVALNFSPSPEPVVGTRGRASITSGSRSRTSRRSARSWKPWASSWTCPTAGAGTEHRPCVHHRSVGHVYRAERRSGQGVVSRTSDLPTLSIRERFSAAADAGEAAVRAATPALSKIAAEGAWVTSSPPATAKNEDQASEVCYTQGYCSLVSFVPLWLNIVGGRSRHVSEPLVSSSSLQHFAPSRSFHVA